MRRCSGVKSLRSKVSAIPARIGLTPHKAVQANRGDCAATERRDRGSVGSSRLPGGRGWLAAKYPGTAAASTGECATHHPFEHWYAFMDRTTSDPEEELSIPLCDTTIAFCNVRRVQECHPIHEIENCPHSNDSQPGRGGRHIFPDQTTNESTRWCEDTRFFAGK
jgi:hypothetical protein